ncbi:hypothetical protein F5H01DRAFT_26410 [Linnemannia elongata]|nr:hypothetical protein F5H01DRAFT_26410 [Linnemannia elongata]
MSSSSPSLSSTQRFFNTPELIALLARYLNRRDVSRLLLTSRLSHYSCQPFLFTHLDSAVLEYGSAKSVKSVFRRQDFMILLAQHVHSVRSLHVKGLDRVYLFNCFLDYQQTLRRTGTDASSTDTGVSIPTWLPPPNNMDFSVIPLAPMSQLKELSIDVAPEEDDRDFSFFHLTVQNCATIFSQVCWNLQLSPRLVKLTVKLLPTKSAREVQFLAGIIARMSTLKALDLEIFINDISDSTEWFRIWVDFLRRTPSSLQKFAFSVGYMATLEGDVGEGVFGGTELMVDPPERQDVLLGLTELELTGPSFSDNFIPANDIQEVLERCPNIDKITFNRLDYWVDEDALTRVLLRCCPKLRRITHDTNYSLSYSLTTNNFLHNLMATLPPNQVEEVECKNYCRELDINGPQPAFFRHSSSLRRILFDNCGMSKGQCIGLVLAECVGLEELELCPKRLGQVSFMYLEDAVASMPWACSKLRHLSFAIARDAIPRDLGHRGSGQVPDCYQIPESEVDLEKKTVQLALLERIYQQIGSLTELRRLNLRSTLVTSGVGAMVEVQDYRHNLFPGLMSLADDETGRQGYLGLLGGLSKLQELRGSIQAAVEKGMETVGWPEVRWMHANWPDLLVGEFYDESDDVGEHFLWLRDQRQQWKLDLWAARPSSSRKNCPI